MMNLPIEHYTVERIANPHPGGKLPWQLYHKVRNDIVRCCRRFGRTGPMGECPIEPGDEPPRSWPVGDKDPDYWVIDDQYNDEQYIYAELLPQTVMTANWLCVIADTLQRHAGWGVGVNSIPNGYVLIFADRLMVHGPAFAGATDVAGVAAKAAATIATRAS